MTNTKLFDYLQSMSSYELNRFHKFVQSPYFNEDDSIARLVAALLPLLKSQTIHQVTEKTIWKKVFGNKSFTQQIYNRLLSDTVKKAEQFLTADAFNRHPHSGKIALLEILNQRRLDKHFPELHRFTHHKLSETTSKDSAFYYQEFQLHQLQNNFIENQNQRTTNKNLQQIFSSIDVFYFIQKLKFYAAALHYGSFLSEQNETALIHEIIAETEKPQYKTIAHLQAYRTIVLTFLEHENDTHFTQLASIIQHESPQFSHHELQSLLSFAINHCIRKINLGKPDFLRALFALYQYALNKKLLLDEKKQLSQWEYKNIVTTALRVKEFKWTEKFLTTFKNTLQPSERDNAFTFNLARYYFATKHYDKVLTMLQQVEYSDIFYQLDSKTTLLKTYYEMGEALPIYSLKDSFRILLRRKKLISDQQKQNYMNLLKFTIRLHKADVRNKKEMTQLKKEIEATENIADKSWLIEKVNELM
jgi:hypothetical protein